MGAECKVAGRYDRHIRSNSSLHVFDESGGKKMSVNIFWTPEEEEILIDFVRNHDILYNIRHPDYRMAQIKQHLWESIGTTLDKSGSDSCKRWGYVRDYCIRRRGKPGSGSSGIAAKERSELLSFLDSFAASQRPTTTNVGSSQGLSDATQLSPTEPDIDMGPGIFTPEILEHDSNDDLGKMENDKVESMPPPKKKKLTHSEERLKLLKQIAERKIAPQNEPDEADLFLDLWQRFIINFLVKSRLNCEFRLAI
ncbi:uncharacterized protein TNIN_107131 [Trichonephila inaurata madagascariensis]|uniref:Myb-like domain-containing protein n=1 Tax=Trichonephila inaurata madagascariensis TaxID=2747483 RepID=A0A8X7CTV5_9ARAC|nr:uncharacterized protein TNIN_107131 [Trichonephila inaurata madagascariensis]